MSNSKKNKFFKWVILFCGKNKWLFFCSLLFFAGLIVFSGKKIYEKTDAYFICGNLVIILVFVRNLMPAKEDICIRIISWYTKLFKSKNVKNTGIAFVYLLMMNEKPDNGYKSSVALYKKIFKKDKIEHEQGLIKKSKKALLRAKKCLLYFGISLLFLYISLFAGQFSTPVFEYSLTPQIPISATYKKDNDSIKFFIKDVFKIKTLKPLKGTDTILNEKTALEIKTPYEAYSRTAIGFISFAANTAGAMFIFLFFSVLYSPPTDTKGKKTQQRIASFSYYFISLIILAFPLFINSASSNHIFTAHGLTGYITFFNGLSGILNAVALFLLIARLDNNLVGLPAYAIATMYVYACVQPLYVVFDIEQGIDKTITTIVLIVVLICKAFFFLVISYAMQTNRLLNYFFCFPELNKRVNAVLFNQFKIDPVKKEKSYSFVIRNGKEIAYTTDRLYESRDTCFNEASKIYKGQATFEERTLTDGTFIIEIKDDMGEVLCFSKNFESANEMTEFLEESKSKLLYTRHSYI